jgi:hypothetical protein
LENALSHFEGLGMSRSKQWLFGVLLVIIVAAPGAFLVFDSLTWNARPLPPPRESKDALHMQIFAAPASAAPKTGKQVPPVYTLKRMPTNSWNRWSFVGRGDNSLRTWVGGSAAAINGSELPGAIRRVINTLQISENTLSLWANVALAQRLCWEIATQADIDPRYIDANLKEGQRKTTNLLRDLQAEFGFSYVLRGILTDLLA